MPKIEEPRKTPNVNREKPYRSWLCDSASKLIAGDRNESYGEPSHNLRHTGYMQAVFWQQYYARHPNDPDARDTGWGVAIDMMLVKISRIASGSYVEDNYKDLIGYAAIAGEQAMLSLPQSLDDQEVPYPDEA